MRLSAVGCLVSVDKQRKDAGIKKKDNKGRTVYDVATPKAKAIIDEWMVEPETESEDEEELVDGLTKTQRSKLKKRELEAKERAGSVMPPPPAPTHGRGRARCGARRIQGG